MQNWKIVKAKKKDKWEKSKGKWKERVKRVAVVGMAVATLFSSLAVASGRLETTFADFSGDSDSGGGLTGGLSQGQKTSWNEQQIGIRFYLVDKNGTRVSKVVDILRSTQNLASVSPSNLFMGDRIGGKKPINISERKQFVYTGVPAFSGFTAWPVDYTSGPTGRGEAFKGWFLGDGSINAPISKFLRWEEDGGDFLFKPKGIQMEIDPANGKPSIEQTMRKHKLSLFAEPILWFTPCTLKPNPDK